MGEPTPAGRFGKRVYARRTQRRQSMKELAAAAGVTTGAIVRAERGDEIGLSIAIRIAGPLGLSLDALFEQPDCDHCEDRPPAGFTCNTCGTGGRTP